MQEDPDAIVEKKAGTTTAVLGVEAGGTGDLLGERTGRTDDSPVTGVWGQEGKAFIHPCSSCQTKAFSSSNTGDIFTSICLTPVSVSHCIWNLGEKERGIISKPLQTPKQEFPFSAALSFLLINLLEERICSLSKRRTSLVPLCFVFCMQLVCTPPFLQHVILQGSDLQGS